MCARQIKRFGGRHTEGLEYSATNTSVLYDKLNASTVSPRPHGLRPSACPRLLSATLEGTSFCFQNIEEAENQGGRFCCAAAQSSADYGECRASADAISDDLHACGGAAPCVASKEKSQAPRRRMSTVLPTIDGAAVERRYFPGTALEPNEGTFEQAQGLVLYRR